MSTPIVWFEHVNSAAAWGRSMTDSGSYISRRVIEGDRLRRLKFRARVAPGKAFNDIKRNPGWDKMEGSAGREKDIRDMIAKVKANIAKREKK